MAGSVFIGMKAHKARLRKLAGEAVKREVGMALFAAGEMIAVEAQISITTGSVSGKNHKPSQPGEAPNQDTGVLGNNIETVRRELLVVEVSSNAPYSTPLEFGTSKMAARPFMAPARDKKRKEAEQLIKRALKRAVQQSG